MLLGVYKVASPPTLRSATVFVHSLRQYTELCRFLTPHATLRIRHLHQRHRHTQGKVVRFRIGKPRHDSRTGFAAKVTVVLTQCIDS